MSLSNVWRPMVTALTTTALLCVGVVTGSTANAAETKTVQLVASPYFMVDNYGWSFELQDWPDTLAGFPVTVNVVYHNGNTQNVGIYDKISGAWRYSTGDNTKSDNNPTCVVSGTAVVPVEYTGQFVMVEGPCATVGAMTAPAPVPPPVIVPPTVLRPLATLSKGCIKSATRGAFVQAAFNNAGSNRPYTFVLTTKVSNAAPRSLKIVVPAKAKVVKRLTYARKVIKVVATIKTTNGKRIMASTIVRPSGCR